MRTTMIHTPLGFVLPDWPILSVQVATLKKISKATSIILGIGAICAVWLRKVFVRSCPIVNMAEGWTEKKSSWGPLESHSLSSVPPCRFFQLGKCIYGENCRYLHELDAETNESNDSCHNVMAVNWVNAPEFIPSSTIYSAADTQLDFPAMQSFAESGIKEAGPSTSQQTSVKSYAKAVDPNAGQSFKIAQSTSELCPYFFMGSCRYGEECTYIHGDLCELCSQHCLHPTDEEQRIEHNQSCLLQHKVDMEKSFAVARSRDKACGICMEIIWEKLPSTKQRFGLLPNCSHCFCLDCIRKWRQEKQFENKIIRSCPECRVQSDFVCPSRYWCETKEEKEKLITDYKGALSNKACKYFNQGDGECPFGNRCFYLHALPDGTRTDVGPPQGKLRRRRFGQDEEEAEVFQVLLWDFLEERESRYVLQLGLDLEDLDLYTSDSDDYYSDEADSLFFLQ
ncbi:probable E3 ubiquitin-protein ligase makorin-1 [Daphnia magna]|uniref:probable E3 ubiquitin-protein ligase makorin-1 n=1 Tax=Daphnia magna TaxID=35525 RepID=UPI001E1BB574|nr:probable E3 ubiquitin-protein ligase makorin-1 [Daphnia magna]